MGGGYLKKLSNKNGSFFHFFGLESRLYKKKFRLIYTAIIFFRGATGRYRRISSSSESPQLKRTNFQQEKQGCIINPGSEGLMGIVNKKLNFIKDSSFEISPLESL